MNQLFFFFALLLFAAAGCKPGAAAPVAGDQAVKSYDARGIVREIASDGSKATIHHGAISNFMPEMTMAFTVKDTNELDGISPGDEITFTLKVDESGHWIEDIRFVAHHISEVTSNVFVFHVRTAELKPGDPMPDGELTAEDGGKIHFSDFRGRALAFTFFFTRCPLPDYCPRMSKNFADARKLLLSAPDGPANWQFLCISFDPGFDTPEMLSSYGNYFREGSTDRWLFAAASTNTLAGLSPQLDLMVLRDGANITHNLRTVVLDTNGKIFRQFDSNEWTPQELADAIRDAAKIPTP